jgi:hypothetical protein
VGIQIISSVQGSSISSFELEERFARLSRGDYPQSAALEARTRSFRPRAREKIAAQANRDHEVNAVES